MRKTAKTGLLVAGCVIAAAVFAAVVMKMASGYLSHAAPEASQGCSARPRNHTIVIQHNQAVPAHLSAPKCDTLTITNLNHQDLLMAFGPHEDHVPYNGVSERLLLNGQSFTVTLNQTGNFRFHDHIHDVVQGTFTVTK